MIISTVVKMVVKEVQRENISHLDDPATGKSIVDQFRYTNVISNHFQLYDAVDDHNNKRINGGDIHGMSLETTWRTIIW